MRRMSAVKVCVIIINGPCRYLDLTSFRPPAENLALDEALLDEAEASATPAETLRLWEPRRPMVVVGRSSQFHVEVRLDACRELGIPVLRRQRRGGRRRRAGLLDVRPGAQLSAAPAVADLSAKPIAGCLARWPAHWRLRAGRRMPRHERFGDRRAEVLGQQRPLPPQSSPLSRHVALRLSAGVGRALPGDAAADAGLSGRPSARELLTNLPLPAETIRNALVDAFAADEPCDSWPEHRTAQLVAEKYSLPEWQMRDWQFSEQPGANPLFAPRWGIHSCLPRETAAHAGRQECLLAADIASPVFPGE